MSALKLSTNPVAPPCGDDPLTAAPGDSDADPAEQERRALPAMQAAEHLVLNRRPVTARPGAITPRRPLSALPSARKASRRATAGGPHPDAAHHVETQEPPETRSHAASAVFTINSELDVDLAERPDTLVIEALSRLAADVRQAATPMSASNEATKR